jgi:hypothetical protein
VAFARDTHARPGVLDLDFAQILLAGDFGERRDEGEIEAADGGRVGGFDERLLDWHALRPRGVDQNNIGASYSPVGGANKERAARYPPRAHTLAS